MVVILGQEKLRFDETGSPYFERTIDKSGKTENVKPENATPQHVKTLNLKVGLTRSGYTPDMREKRWFGVADLTIAIPNEKPFKNYFLVYDKRSMSTVVCKILSPSWQDSLGNYNSIAWTLSLQPAKDSLEADWFEMSEAKEVTEMALMAMLARKEVLCVLSDMGERC